MQGQSLKVTLPGEMYERAGRWWWRVKLPGEDKARARPLRAPDAKTAACDRDTAQRLAVAMWEQAVAQSGAKQITLDCAQKVERLKAQFLDKVRHLTEIVEAANAKAQAEAQARAQIETRLNAMIQAAEQKAAAPSAPIQDFASPRPPQPTPPGEARPEVTESGKCAMHADNPQMREDRATNNAAEAVPEAPLESSPGATADHDSPPQTGTCECCGAAGVPIPDLASIDSGQLLCPDCFAALRIDISRIESQTFSHNHA